VAVRRVAHGCAGDGLRWVVKVPCRWRSNSGHVGTPRSDRVRTARTARRIPPSACSRVASLPGSLARCSLWSRLASLATDHSGRASAPVGAVPAGLNCMCPRRQRFTRSGPTDLETADRDGRGCVAANGECAGRSLRAGRRAVLVVITSCRRALARARGRSRRRERERVGGTIERRRRRNPAITQVVGAARERLRRM